MAPEARRLPHSTSSSATLRFERPTQPAMNLTIATPTQRAWLLKSSTQIWINSHPPRPQNSLCGDFLVNFFLRRYSVRFPLHIRFALPHVVAQNAFGQRAENGALDPWSLDLRLGCPRLPVQRPPAPYFEGFRSDLEQKSGAPQTQIQQPRIQRPILDPLIGNLGGRISERVSGLDPAIRNANRGDSQRESERFARINSNR